MTPKAIIRWFIPDLVEAVLEEEQSDWYSGGDFMLYKISRKHNPEHQYVCLLSVMDYVPEPFWGSRAIDAIEDYFGLYVRGCFLAGSGEVLERGDTRLINGKLPENFDGKTVFRENKRPYYLYLLSNLQKS